MDRIGTRLSPRLARRDVYIDHRIAQLSKTHGCSFDFHAHRTPRATKCDPGMNQVETTAEGTQHFLGVIVTVRLAKRGGRDSRELGESDNGIRPENPGFTDFT